MSRPPRSDRPRSRAPVANATAKGLTRRQFVIRSAATAAGAAVSTYGFSWGDLAYGQQLAGKPVSFNVAIRPDWTQGWFGMINQDKQIWKKYLPPGSEVTFSHPIQGGIVTNELIAEKSMIGHNGDAPGLIATFQRERADIRAIGLIGTSPSGYHCYQVLVRKDAPEFTSSKEALKWLDGKKVATPKGSCSDRFFQYVLGKEGIKPAEYLNLSIGVITTNLRTGQIDGACTWDPQGAAVSTIAGEGTARVVATGEPWGERDSGTIVCRKDFIDKNRDVVKAWLKAEIESQLWYCDPRNHAEVLAIAQKYVKGFSHKALWFSLAGLAARALFRRQYPRREAVRVERRRQGVAGARAELPRREQGHTLGDASARCHGRLAGARSHGRDEGVLAAGAPQGRAARQGLPARPGPQPSRQVRRAVRLTPSLPLPRLPWGPP